MLYDSDRKYDKNQRTPVAAKGQQVSAWALNKLRDLILNHVQSGRGIDVERRGERVFIHAKVGGAGAGMGSGGAGTWMVYGDTFATLPSIDGVNKFARVTTGDDKGMTCVVNADADGWVPFTHFG